MGRGSDRKMAFSIKFREFLTCSERKSARSKNLIYEKKISHKNFRFFLTKKVLEEFIGLFVGISALNLVQVGPFDRCRTPRETYNPKITEFDHANFVCFRSGFQNFEHYVTK